VLIPALSYHFIIIIGDTNNGLQITQLDDRFAGWEWFADHT